MYIFVQLQSLIRPEREVRLVDFGNSLLHQCYLSLSNQGMLILFPEITCVTHLM